MLAHRIGAARQGKLITGKVAADRKQHRHAAPHRKGGIGEAIGIEIEDLPAAAAPPRQQAAPLGHEPELITAGGILEIHWGQGSLIDSMGMTVRRRRWIDRTRTTRFDPYLDVLAGVMGASQSQDREVLGCTAPCPGRPTAMG